mmetsp:Transcript_51584/g.84238  ORF Transcript_51584/g.84238 Transcript_51584/m.84238 type:complete len:217 (-) Transcript_51584:84-734(-)
MPFSVSARWLGVHLQTPGDCRLISALRLTLPGPPPKHQFRFVLSSFPSHSQPFALGRVLPPVPLPPSLEHFLQHLLLCPHPVPLSGLFVCNPCKILHLRRVLDAAQNINAIHEEIRVVALRHVSHGAIAGKIHVNILANVFLQLPLGGRVHQLALLQFSKGETPLAIGILDCVVQFLCQRAVQSASIVSHVMRSNTFCRFEALQHYGACLHLRYVH